MSSNFKSVGFSCPVDLSRSTFEGQVQLCNVTFSQQVTAEAAIFQSGLSGQESSFEAVAFRRSKFIKNLECVKCDFEGSADFRDASFGRLGSFIGSHFQSNINFRYTQFSAGANFSNATLGGGPRLSFSGPFYMAEFGGQANFRHTHFRQLRMLRSVFRNGADFSRAQGKRLQLHGLDMNGELSLDGAKIADLELDKWGGSMVVDGDGLPGRRSQVANDAPRGIQENSRFPGSDGRFEVLVDGVSFEGDLRFEDSALPGTQETVDEPAKPLKDGNGGQHG